MSETLSAKLSQTTQSWSLRASFLDALEYMAKHNLLPKRRITLTQDKIDALNRLAAREHPRGGSISGDEFFNRSIVEVERLAEEKRREAAAKRVYDLVS